MFGPAPSADSVYGPMGPSLTLVPSTVTPATPSDATAPPAHRANANGRPVDAEPGSVDPMANYRWSALADNPTTWLVLCVGAAIALARYAATGHL